MTKQEEMKEGSTLYKCADDEPVFVLRAQDVLAPTVVKVWAELAKTHGVDWKKTAEAEILADHMKSWAKVHGSKVPD